MRRGIVILDHNKLNFFVGVNTGYASGGEPDGRLVEFYAKRSSSSLYCSIVGNVTLPNGHPSNDHTSTISGSHIWFQLTRVIESRGTVPGIQLATAWKNYTGQKMFKARDSGKIISQCKELAGSVSKRDIRQLFVALDEGTSLALDAGFRHIQLHAAHGYLFSLLVDKRLFAGADDVLAGIKEWANNWTQGDVETSVRISLRTGDAAFDSQGTREFQDLMSRLPVSYIDVSSGFYDVDKQLIYPARPNVLSDRRIETVGLAVRHPETDFIYSGRALQQTGGPLPSNVHIGVCRDLIANPQYLAERSRGCKNYGKCHYHSRGAVDMTCRRWSEC